MCRGGPTRRLGRRTGRLSQLFRIVSSLWKAKQLTPDEVKMLFNYYLQPLATLPFLKAFIHDYDFDNLEALLEALYHKDTRRNICPSTPKRITSLSTGR